MSHHHRPRWGRNDHFVWEAYAIMIGAGLLGALLQLIIDVLNGI